MVSKHNGITVGQGASVGFLPVGVWQSLWVWAAPDSVSPTGGGGVVVRRRSPSYQTLQRNCQTQLPSSHKRPQNCLSRKQRWHSSRGYVGPTPHTRALHRKEILLCTLNDPAVCI
jgi:hypothetical protein